MRNKRTTGKGFTLIELLVAICILAIVAVLGWRGLDGIVRARIALNSDLEQTRGMQLAFAQMQSDSAHVANAADIGGRPPVVADQDRLTMVRIVFADNQPSRVQVVAYRIVNGVLIRRETAATRDLQELDTLWQAASNDTDRSQPVALQAAVDAMTIRTWSTGSNAWSGTGPDASSVVIVQNQQNQQSQQSQPGQQNPQNPQTPTVTAPVMKGLEVSLRLRGRTNNMVKVFLLGAV